jgi:hypothetical protein
MNVHAHLIAAIAIAALAGCAFDESDKTEMSPITRTDLSEATAPPSADQCDASRYRYLIGKLKSEIPQRPPGAAWRIACTACAVTMDYVPARLNIFFDEKTQVIEQVKCG